MFSTNYSTPPGQVKYFTLIVCLLMASCVSIQPPTPPLLPWQSYLPQLEKLHAWKWQGQIAISSPEGRSSFQVTWQQFGEKNFEIHLFGPLAQNHVRFKCDLSGCVLHTPQQTFSSDSPEKLLYEYFGWEIPIQEVSFWLKGIPSPKEPYEFTENSQGLLQTLKQLGWQIRYTEYHANSEKLPLPRKLVLEHDKLRIRVVINQWKTP